MNGLLRYCAWCVMCLQWLAHRAESRALVAQDSQDAPLVYPPTREGSQRFHQALRIGRYVQALRRGRQSLITQPVRPESQQAWLMPYFQMVVRLQTVVSVLTLLELCRPLAGLVKRQAPKALQTTLRSAATSFLQRQVLPAREAGVRCQGLLLMLRFQWAPRYLHLGKELMRRALGLEKSPSGVLSSAQPQLYSHRR